FSAWTDEGLLRHPSFQGLREDKDAREVRRERPAAGGAATAAQAAAAPRGGSARSGVRLSHPDRVLYPEQGITKRELADYYAAIADRILPQLVDRPLMLVRCPRGHGQKCFYQRHASDGLPPEIRTIPV